MYSRLDTEQVDKECVLTRALYILEFVDEPVVESYSCSTCPLISRLVRTVCTRLNAFHGSANIRLVVHASDRAFCYAQVDVVVPGNQTAVSDCAQQSS